MKRIGYALIAVGFLGGAFTAVRQVEGVNGLAYVGWLVTGVIGVVAVRRAGRREATDTVRLSADIESLEASLRQVTDQAERLEAEKEMIDVYELRRVIDRRFPDELVRFVDARESIAHRFGLNAYAEVMHRFAAGERYLNRVWSASTDGYVDEAHEYIGRAARQFADALRAFVEIRDGADAADRTRTGEPSPPGA